MTITKTLLAFSILITAAFCADEPVSICPFCIRIPTLKAEAGELWKEPTTLDANSPSALTAFLLRDVLVEGSEHYTKWERFITALHKENETTGKHEGQRFIDLCAATKYLISKKQADLETYFLEFINRNSDHQRVARSLGLIE